MPPSTPPPPPPPPPAKTGDTSGLLELPTDPTLFLLSPPTSPIPTDWQLQVESGPVATDPFQLDGPPGQVDLGNGVVVDTRVASGPAPQIHGHYRIRRQREYCPRSDDGDGDAGGGGHQAPKITVDLYEHISTP